MTAVLRHYVLAATSFVVVTSLWMVMPPSAHAVFAGALLRALPAAEETTKPAYSRAKFKHWTTTSGCTARQHVLFRFNTARSDTGCKAQTGRWVSPYDGVVLADASALDIDHMIPLAEAWRSGASTKWDAATRERFANDLGCRFSLIAASASSNRSKGDQDPSEWVPPLDSYQCRYAVNWIAVKYRWRLAVDQAERGALVGMMRGCPRRVIVMPIAPPRAVITDSPTPAAPKSPADSTTDDAPDSGIPMQPDLAGDQDCSDFDGPVKVLPGDPDDLDRDGDGIGCDAG